MPTQRPLTPRQHLILRHVGRGLTNKEIANELGISEQGVKVHISRLLERYGAANRVELVGRTRAWSDAEERSYAALSADLAGVTKGLARDAADTSSIGQIRSSLQEQSSVSDGPLPSGASSDVVKSLATVRELLTEVDVAIKLARELPADATSGPLVEAIRARLRAAMAESDRLIQTIGLAREAGTAEGPFQRTG